MLNAFLYGLLATSSLVLGGMIASRFTFSNRLLGAIMAFGAGIITVTGFFLSMATVIMENQ